MAFNINAFKSNLQYGGARTNLFEMQLGFPPGLDNISEVGVELNEFSRKLKFLCSVASIPSASIGEVVVPFYGRDVYAAGTRTFEALSLNIINDEDFYIRKAFEGWIGAINGNKSNDKNSGANSSPSSYQVDGLLKQYSQYVENNEYIPIRTYKFVNLFPTDISTIELSWDSSEIQRFSVTLRYDYWVIGPNE